MMHNPLLTEERLSSFESSYNTSSFDSLTNKSYVFTTTSYNSPSSLAYYMYSNSDGFGNEGSRPDCGAISSSSYLLNACPNDCSQKGRCDTTTYTCQCYEGFWGPDCSLRLILYACMYIDVHVRGILSLHEIQLQELLSLKL